MRAIALCVTMMLVACEPPTTTITGTAPDATAQTEDEGPADSDAGNDDLGVPECVADMDCCPNPAYDCGMRCTSGACEYLAAPTEDEDADGDEDEDTEADENPPSPSATEGHSEDENLSDDAGRDDEAEDDCIPESCDMLDNDCDGVTDNGCPLIGDEDENQDEDAGTDATTDTNTDMDGTVEAVDETDDPVTPLDDLSVGVSWKTDDIVATVPDGEPVRVRTVLDGYATTDLAARFVGFVPNPLTNDSRDVYYLMETDPADPRWNLLLGAVAGMSGSPCIIRGRTAGALSYSIGDDLGPYLFVATPIEKMLDVEAQELDAVLAEGAEPIGDPLAAVMAIPSGASAWFEGASLAADDRFLVLADDIVAGAATGGMAPPLGPGSSIAVLVITGDVLNFGGIGTVTATDGDALWAFGHPMTGTGDVSFPFSAASIEAIAASAAWGYAYKVGAPTGLVLGAITNDRTAAIAGRHDIRPPTVQVFTHGTYDGVVEHVGHNTARLAGSPWFDMNQAFFAAVWPLTVQRDTPFGGTGSIRYTVQVTVGESEAIAEHTDIISSTWWPEAELFDDFFDAAVPLLADDRLPLTLTSVILTADVSDDRREYEIDDLTHAEKIAPGDELVVAVELLPFGESEPVTRALVLAIPADFPPGPATLRVGPETMLGSRSPWDSWMDPACGDTDVTEQPEDLIAKFNILPRRMVLVGQLRSWATPNDDCPPCVLDLDADGNPKGVCPTCESDAALDPCAPPMDPPTVRVTSEEDGAITGFRTVTITVTGEDSDSPPLEPGEIPSSGGTEGDEGLPTECPPDGCPGTTTDPPTDSGGEGGGGGEETPPPTESAETPCPVGDEVCDGCDNDGDGESDEGCPP